jgi:predicted methyltransferase
VPKPRRCPRLSRVKPPSRNLVGALVLFASSCSRPAEAPPPSPTPAPASDISPVEVIAPPESTAAVQPGAPAPVAPETPLRRAEAIVAAPDRSPEDRALDAGRHPAELLAFFGIGPGMRVAELFAGGGYTTELLARAVGETGVVYGQNTKFILERFAEKPWSERLSKPVMKHVVRVDRELGDPLPPEAKNLDAVLAILVYHDFVWLKADRDKLNRSVYGALKPGGVYGIVDHSSKPGDGIKVTESLHRIEESALVAEVKKAGFVLDGAAEFLRNPSDTRDWSTSPRTAGEKRGTSDRFVLRFKKP